MTRPLFKVPGAKTEREILTFNNWSRR